MSGTTCTLLAGCVNLCVAAFVLHRFAVRGYTDALRQELAPFNVRVMHVAPGAALCPCNVDHVLLD